MEPRKTVEPFAREVRGRAARMVRAHREAHGSWCARTARRTACSGLRSMGSRRRSAAAGRRLAKLGPTGRAGSGSAARPRPARSARGSARWSARSANCARVFPDSIRGARDPRGEASACCAQAERERRPQTGSRSLPRAQLRFAIDALARRIVARRVSRTAQAGFVLDARDAGSARTAADPWRRSRASRRSRGAALVAEGHWTTGRGGHRFLRGLGRRPVRQRARPGRSSASSRPRSSAGGGRGEASRRWSSPPSNRSSARGRERVDGLNHRRLPEPVGPVPPAEAENRRHPTFDEAAPAPQKPNEIPPEKSARFSRRRRAGALSGTRAGNLAVAVGLPPRPAAVPGPAPLTRFGYHNSHEQFAPARLLGLAKLAHEVGFRVASASDHFHPWSGVEQGQSGFVWSWLGAAMEATGLEFRTVSCPGWRYHPAILAQAGATPVGDVSRAAVDGAGLGAAPQRGDRRGSTGLRKAERNARLLECVEVMRALWAGRDRHPSRADRGGGRDPLLAARAAAPRDRRRGEPRDGALVRRLGRRADHGGRRRPRGHGPRDRGVPRGRRGQASPSACRPRSPGTRPHEAALEGRLARVAHQRAAGRRAVGDPHTPAVPGRPRPSSPPTMWPPASRSPRAWSSTPSGSTSSAGWGSPRS